MGSWGFWWQFTAPRYFFRFSGTPSGRAMLPEIFTNFREQLTTFGDKKRWDVSSNRNDWKPQKLLALSNRSVRFKSVRSGTKKNSLGKATFSSPSPLYSLYSRAYVVKQISRREFPVHHFRNSLSVFPRKVIGAQKLNWIVLLPWLGQFN